MNTYYELAKVLRRIGYYAYLSKHLNTRKRYNSVRLTKSMFLAAKSNPNAWVKL